MSNTTPENVKSMAAILSAMNAATGDTPVTHRTLSEGTGVIPKAVDALNVIMENFRAATGDDEAPSRSVEELDTGSLNHIMEGFRAATDDAVDGAMGNPTLERAYKTVRDEKGVRVGSWRIDVREEAGMGKFYNVAHSMTGEPIINDLRLYEAALALVNGLNEGQTINSSRSKLILEFENDYARALSDAVSFKSTAQLNEGMKRDVAEARYSEARRKAIAAKKAITKFTDL